MTKQHGFVLATTIWMIAILTLLGSLFHGYVRSQLEQAQALRDQLDYKIDLESTAQTLRYLLVTRHFSWAGLTVLPENQRGFIDVDGYPERTPTGHEIRLDGSIYRGFGCVRFAVQDQAGLIGLNSRGLQGWLERVLTRRYSAMQVQPLMATLADYIDANDRRRLGGAERIDYLQAGMPAPSNYYLRSDAELDAVHGWRRWLAENPQWRRWTDTGRNSVFNINTVPSDLLAILLDIGEEEATRLVRARITEPFFSMDGVAEELNRLNRWPADFFRFSAAERLTLELWCDGYKYSTVQGLQLTPNGLYGPEQTDYYYRRTRNVAGRTGGKVLEVPGGYFTDTLPVNP